MRKIKKANLISIFKIWEIRKIASNNLKKANIDQWQYKDPSFLSFVKDIFYKRLYILKENKEIVAIMMLNDYEKTYLNIEGKWSSDNKYIVIHKLASKYSQKGYAKYLLNYAENYAKAKNINYLRIDTHEKNEKMLKLLNNLNYRNCGIIYLEIKQGDKMRIAFDKLLK